MSSSASCPTEADFEAAIARVLRTAFPALSAMDLRHQLSFQIRLGRKTHHIESGIDDWAAGRCDLLITQNGRPLAIIELKRPGIELTDDDRIQGLSYARLMQPWPPLVIVSNQDETRIYETFSGNEWNPSSRDEATLSDLFRTSASLASGDLKNAVETLLGASKQCWTSVVRSFTQQQIDRLTGPWDDLLAPFPEGLLLPRKATTYLKLCLEKTEQVPFVVGPPLSGKSNVLREFVHGTADSAAFVALYIDADSSRHGIFQTIANLMTESLGWGFDANQARTWLHRLSRSGNPPALVLMVDGGNATSLKAELDELVSGAYGPNLRLVISIDRNAVKQFLTSTTGRQRTTLGTKAAVIEVAPLDDEEFEVAQTVLYDLRFAFMHGSQRSADHRVPWLLRSLVAIFRKEPKFIDVSLAAAIPSVPGMQSLSFAEQRFGHDATLKGRYLRIAEAVISDVEKGPKDVETALLIATTYVCRLETLQRFLGEAEIAELTSDGHLKHHVVGTDRLVVPQLPTFVASCAADSLAVRIATDFAGDPRTGADRLVAICSKIPLGEVIGAQVLYQIMFRANQILYEIVQRLFERVPSREPIPPGTKFATLVDGKRLDFEIFDQRRFVAVLPNGERYEFANDVDESPQKAQGEMTPWLILSHFAIVPTTAYDCDTNVSGGRFDAWLLLEIASYKNVLIRPEGATPAQIAVHEMDDDTVIVCHQEGIIEPITFSLYSAMTRERELANGLIDEAVKRRALPLLSRMNIGLLQIEQQANTEKAEWAASVRNNKVLPTFRDTVLNH